MQKRAPQSSHIARWSLWWRTRITSQHVVLGERLPSPCQEGPIAIVADSKTGRRSGAFGGPLGGLWGAFGAFGVQGRCPAVCQQSFFLGIGPCFFLALEWSCIANFTICLCLAIPSSPQKLRGKTAAYPESAFHASPNCVSGS